jgi:hypothetical protein
MITWLPNGAFQLQAGFSKARDSAPLLLHFKAIKRDGFLEHRA